MFGVLLLAGRTVRAAYTFLAFFLGFVYINRGESYDNCRNGDYNIIFHILISDIINGLQQETFGVLLHFHSESFCFL